MWGSPAYHMPPTTYDRAWDRRNERLINSCRDRSLRLLREVHRPAAARRGADRRHADQLAFPGQSVWRPHQGVSVRFRSARLLAEHLRGVSVLYNTYWVRFNHRLFKHADAVRNTLALFEAAKQAGVERIVHVSITNPSRGLAAGVLPRQGDPGEGPHRVRHFLRHPPARGPLRQGGHPHQQHRLGLAAAAGRSACSATAATACSRSTSMTWPPWRSNRARAARTSSSTPSGRRRSPIGNLWRGSARLIGKRRPIVSVPPWLGYAVGWLLGKLVGDVVITQGRDRGPDGRPVVRRCPARRADGPDRVGQGARRHSGAAVHQRVGKAERSGVGV